MIDQSFYDNVFSALPLISRQKHHHSCTPLVESFPKLFSVLKSDMSKRNIYANPDICAEHIVNGKRARKKSSKYDDEVIDFTPLYRNQSSDSESSSDDEQAGIFDGESGDEAPDLIEVPVAPKVPVRLPRGRPPRAAQPNAAPAPDDNPDWELQVEQQVLSEFRERHAGFNHKLAPTDPVKNYFFEFVPAAMIATIVLQTNLFFAQNNNGATLDLTTDEFEAFLGTIIALGVYATPRLELVFSDSKWCLPYVRDVFPRDRWKLINSHIHLVDNTQTRPANGEPGHDKLWKVRWFIDGFLERCKKLCTVGEFLALDEAMVAFKGRLAFKQYNPMKPTKWGIKLFVVACSITGFVHNFVVYTGKSQSAVDESQSATWNTVMQLLTPYFGHWRRVFFDNYYTSFALILSLLANKMYACGTIRTNRKGFPTELKEMKKLNRGDAFSRSVLTDHGQINAYVWQDTKTCYFLDSAAIVDLENVCLRTNDRGERTEVPCPLAVTQYAKNMGGVDRSDQYGSYYKIGRTSRRWYIYLYWHIMDLAIVNAYLMWKANQTDEKVMDQLAWRMRLADELIGERCYRKKTCTTSQINHSDPNNKYHHRLQRTDRRMDCAICSSQSKESDQNRKRTRFYCQPCNVWVCPDDCYDNHREACDK